ncbi:MAG: ABC transporter substrate binding protein, partial [Anaerolineae bacterium]
ESVLDQEDVELQIEYMDTKRIFDETYLQKLHQIYQHKFGGSKFDAVISSDDNAFDFLLQHRDALFPGTPVVFCGVNFFKDSDLEGHNLFTGVNEEIDLRASLDVALELHPHTKQVVIVNDTTMTGLKIHEKIAEVMPDYVTSIKFTLLEDVDMEEIQARVQKLPSSSLVLYTIFFRDKSGKFFEYDESISLIAAESAVPIYGTWDFSLGYGIVGGMLTSGYAQGGTAAQLALRVLQGENVAAIPVVQSPNRYMFDYEQMQRFGLGLSNLPSGSTVINQPSSFYTEYKSLVWGIIIGVAVFAAIILALLTATLRRRQVEKELRERNRELQIIRDSLEQYVTARTADLERRSTHLEAAAHVAKDAAAIRDVELMLNETVRLISDRFGFYHAGIFLLDEARDYAVLRAASSEGGQQMLARGHKLKVGETGIVGIVASSGHPRIALDVGEDVTYFDNPDLPRTRSELAVPLAIRGRVIGILDVQSTQEAAFSSEDIAVLQVLADQVALAIENVRLLEEVQGQLRETSALAGQYEKEGWQQLIEEQSGWGYVYDGVDVMPRDQAPAAEATSQLTLPLQVRNETIGNLNLVLGDQPASPEEIDLAQAITEQASQALERARLFQETQRRVTRERVIREISDKMQRATDQETLMRVAAEELNRVLGASRTYVRLGTEEELRHEPNV